MKKARILQCTFASKAQLPLLVHNEYSPVDSAPLVVGAAVDWNEEREPSVLKSLPDDSAVGPELVSQSVAEMRCAAFLRSDCAVQEAVNADFLVLCMLMT